MRGERKNRRQKDEIRQKGLKNQANRLVRRTLQQRATEKEQKNRQKSYKSPVPQICHSNPLKHSL